MYLFATDGSAINLCLGIGTTTVPSHAALKARTTALRELCTGIGDLELEPKLGPAAGRSAVYGKGTVVAKVYDPRAMPDEQELADDLGRILGFADTAYEQGLRFQQTFEPIHLFYPWVEDATGGGIVNARRAIAEQEGAAWWVTNTPVAADKLAAVSSQLASDIPTYAYLYAAGDSWRTRILELTTDANDVLKEPTLLATGAKPIPDRLSMKLSGFVPMDTTWTGEQLFHHKTGEAITTSVAKRPSFTYVFSGFAQDALPAGTVVAPSPPPGPPAGPSKPSRSLDQQLTDLASESGLAEDLLKEMYAVLLSKQPQLILAGPPGTGKTWLAKRLALLGPSVAADSFELVQFHPSYAYEDFIEGLRPVVKGNLIEFQNAPGHLLRLVDKLPNGAHTLIIDEMNRANIPSVFGELMYLLEYRDEVVHLRLSGEFSLPAQVRFLATMNTADRSIRSVDSALRRRFEYFEVFPDARALANYYASGQGSLGVPDLVDGFERLNTRLTAAIDRHHGIGHSFFMRTDMDARTLRAIWTRQVRPLIEEYFFDEPNRVDAEFQMDELWPSLKP